MDCEGFSGKFDATQTFFSQKYTLRMPGKYPAIEQEWCPHRQEKINDPVIEYFLHEMQTYK